MLKINITEWTVDTNILYKAVDYKYLDYTLFLDKIKKNGDMICHDYEGKIHEEYQRAIRANNKMKFLNEWYIHMIKNGKIMKYSGKLYSKHRRSLTRKRFHDDDMHFVAVCFASKNKILITIDTHYNDTIVEYLTKHMKLKIIKDINEAISLT